MSDYPFVLGPCSSAVTTTSEEVRTWFDRGLVWTFGYNHEDAVHCFQRATEADPACAMARWGISYAAGPNFNIPWWLMDLAFPDPKVIHAERLEDEGWASYSKTFGKFWQHYRTLPMQPELIDMSEAMDELLTKGVFDGSDREICIANYTRYNALVRETISADRLLVFAPSDGWKPLCRFLGVPVPDGDFPRSNARDEFWALFGGEPATA